eukprot:g31217.t1
MVMPSDHQGEMVRFSLVRDSHYLAFMWHNYYLPLTSLNDYCPIALTSIIMKCFKRLVMAHITSSLPTCLDSLQFAYQHTRSAADAISLVLHSSLEHLDNKD